MATKKSNPVADMMKVVQELAKDKTQLLAVEISIVGVYPDVEGTGLERVEFGTVSASPAISGSGKLNYHGQAKAADPTGKGVARWQIGFNCTGIKSDLW